MTAIERIREELKENQNIARNLRCDGQYDLPELADLSALESELAALRKDNERLKAALAVRDRQAEILARQHDKRKCPLRVSEIRNMPCLDCPNAFLDPTSQSVIQLSEQIESCLRDRIKSALDKARAELEGK